MKARKSWADRVRSARPHQVKPAPMDIAGMRAGQIMLVPSPRIIDEMIRAIPAGDSVDARTLRQRLARKYRAEVCCPITTGILLRMVAEAAYEAHRQGAALGEITPFWRVLDGAAPAAKKLACGAGFISRQRKREGLAP